jgi:aflatoxin B1 aldehyde reductase
VYCIHTPDRRIPWKETLAGANELYKQGAFKRLGLSNFLPHEVEEVIAVAKENNFVVPTVYEGNYSAVARRTETELFPVLRKHGMAFYAYSPIAGGFLSKSKAELTDAEGRFGAKNPLAPVYNAMYNKPSFVAALDVWDQIARDEGVSRAELAYRWIVYHSKLQGDLGDAVIVGARKHEQLRETVAAIEKGPLSDHAVKRIDEVWESIKADALLDNFEITGKQ